VKEAPDRWLFTLSVMDGRHVGDYVSPFAPTSENVAVFNRGVADLAQRLRIYLETDDPTQVPQQPSPFAELTHPDALVPDWVQTDTSGKCRTFVDRAGLTVRDTGVLAWVRYELNPPGTDKLTGQPVAEMWGCEEHDLANGTYRLLRIVFKYTDGSQGEPGRPSSGWKPTAAGQVRTQEFLRMAISHQGSPARLGV
jgi:hypothetical protein